MIDFPNETDLVEGSIVYVIDYLDTDMPECIDNEGQKVWIERKYLEKINREEDEEECGVLDCSQRYKMGCSLPKTREW